jgi:molybdopterin synthase sulfur carrier subunit
MVKVMLWGSLKPAAEGKTEIYVEASNVQQMLDAVGRAYPGLAPVLDRGVSVAIDGQMHRDGGFLALEEDSEVYIFPRLEGG